ncbi:ABC transporter ATP-binding protein [Myxococcota bacterium]|nr:ABC transporter ATP-binding protein [Myxococcota bacterium]
MERAAPASVVTARGLGRRVGGRPVLAGVDLDLHPGEVVGLIGPNGGGKSTLLLLLAGLLRPTQGEVRVQGLPATEVARRAQGRVGLLTADPGLYPLLTGRENLRFFGGLYGLDAAEVDRRTGPLLDELHLGAAVDRPVHTGSSGMRQKLSLARALLMDPVVLLLDEPTANLDPVSARTIWQVVRQRADRGLAVVVCTHDLVAAERLCERVLLLAGRVLQETTFPSPRGLPPVGQLFAPYQDALDRQEGP